MNDSRWIYWLLFLCAVALPGCDGGVSGTGFGEDPVNDSGPPVTSPPPVNTPPILDDQPAPQPPVDPPDQMLLSALFGNTRFVYQFTGEEDIFTYVSMIDSGNLAITNNGTGLLEGIGNLTRQAEEGADTEQLGQQPYACVVIPGTSSYLCVIVLSGDNSAAYFLFDELTDGESTGDFEFCNRTNETVEDCFDELLKAPDGSVLITVEPVADEAFRIPTMENPTIDSQAIMNHMLYLDQASDSMR